MRARPLAVVLVLACGSCTRSGPQVAWEPHVDIASGPAIRGPWQMNDSDYRWVDDATVDVAPDGDVVVAWVDQEKKDLFLQRYGAEGRSRLPSPANVSRSPATFSWLPRVVVSEKDPNVVSTLWQEIVFSGGTHGGEIFFARSTDGGTTFGEPINLSASTAGDGKGRLDEKTWDNGSLDLAPAPEGDLFAAWTEYEGTLWLRHSADGGATWGPAAHVAGDRNKPARAPSIAAPSPAVVWVAWAVGEDPKGDVYVARSTDGGRSFGGATAFGEPEGHADAPQIAVDKGGTLHLVFAESDRGRGGDYRVRYARSKRGANAFEAVRDLGGGSAPTVSADARGRVYVVAERHRGDRRQGLTISYSLDGGDRFAGPEGVPGAGGDGLNGSQQGNLGDKLAVDRNGLLAIVNSTFEEARASRVRLVRGRLR